MAERAELRWGRTDTVILAALLLAGLVTRFWYLGTPSTQVSDETIALSQAAGYLSGQPVIFLHPPLETLLVAADIALLGDHPFSWRLPNAVLGVLLVGITYLLGRRMLDSRLSAALAAGAVLFDGMFLVLSRLAITNIVYLAFGAWSYLLLFRFIQSEQPPARRRATIVWLGVALGLGLASKLAIPVITWLLVSGFLIFALVRDENDRRPDTAWLAGGTLALMGGVGVVVYLSVFLPNYWFGWWEGIGDFVQYQFWAVEYNLSVGHVHRGASPWWSWPLLLRPFSYRSDWTSLTPPIKLSAIWSGGNPALWWGAFGAIVITAIKSLRRACFCRAFILVGYLGYMAMWIPIRRYLFIYDYLPALYLAYLALGMTLGEFWRGNARAWEHVVLLFTLAPSLILGLGTYLGLVCSAAVAISYLIMHLCDARLVAGRFVCALIVAGALILFVYFFPIWVAWPMTRSSYLARLWLHGHGLLNWE